MIIDMVRQAPHHEPYDAGSVPFHVILNLIVSVTRIPRATCLGNGLSL